MRLLLLTLFVLIVPVAQAARTIESMQLEGLSAPYFDPAGRLTHKLTAKAGTARGDDRLLHDVEVIYFAPGDPERIVQRITAVEAIFSEKKETLTGSGPIQVTTDSRQQLSGVGFDFSLGTSVLNLHREVKMEDTRFVITGDRATADLVIDREGGKLKYRDVRAAKFTGNLHVVAVKPAKGARFEEAFTDLALYDGMTRTITMPNQVREIGRSDKGGRVESTTRRATITLADE